MNCNELELIENTWKFIAINNYNFKIVAMINYDLNHEDRTNLIA